MRRLFPVVAAPLVASVLGCGGEKKFEHEPTVSLDTVPASVKAVAAKELPGVDFEQAWKLKAAENDGEEAYEIRGRNKDGKTREIRVSASGKVLEKE